QEPSGRLVLLAHARPDHPLDPPGTVKIERKNDSWRKPASEETVPWVRGTKAGNFFTSPLISFRPSQLLLGGIELRQSGRWGKPGGPLNACLKAKRGTEAPGPCYHRCSRFACPASRCRLCFRRENGIGRSLRSCSWRRQRKRHLPLGLILG